MKIRNRRRRLLTYHIPGTQARVAMVAGRNPSKHESLETHARPICDTITIPARSSVEVTDSGHPVAGIVNHKNIKRAVKARDIKIEE